MQSGVITDQRYEGGISYQGHGVHTKEHHKQDQLHPGVCREAHQDEVHHCVIASLHGYKESYLRREKISSA